MTSINALLTLLFRHPKFQISGTLTTTVSCCSTRFSCFCVQSLKNLSSFVATWICGPILQSPSGRILCPLHSQQVRGMWKQQPRKLQVRATRTYFSSFYWFPQLPAKASPYTGREQLKGRVLPRRSSGRCRMEHPRLASSSPGRC